MNTRFIALAVLMLTASLSLAQTSEEAEFIFAKKAFNDGFYSLARENLEDYLKVYPATDHLYEAHLLLGRSLYYQNDYKGAFYEFDIVLNSPSASGFEDSALYWTGDLYFKNKDFKRSLEAYQKILDEYPASRYYPNALYSKGWSYYRLGLFEDAMTAFAETAAKYGFDSIGMDSLFKIGECEYLMGKYKSAEDSLNTFIEKYPLSQNTAESYYLMADARFEQGEYNGALNYFNRAVSISPRAKWSALALYRMAQANFETKNYDESLRKFEESARASKDDFLTSNSLLGMARNYRMKGALGDCLKICDEVTSRFPRSDASSEAYYIKAGVLSSQEKYRQAEEICLKALDKFNSPERRGKLQYQLATVYFKEGRTDEAESQFEMAIESLKSDSLISGALCMMGDIHIKKGGHDEAMEKFGLVLKSYPGSGWGGYAQMRVGDIFMATKRYDQAILAYQSAATNFGQASLKEKIALRLAMAYFNKEDFLRASEEFKKLSGMEAKFFLANSLYGMNKYSEAMDLFMWIAKNGSDRSIIERSEYQSCWCRYRMGKETEAADDFGLFIKRYPDSVYKKDALDMSISILSTAAQNFEKWKMPDDAARLYEKLNKLKNGG